MAGLEVTVARAEEKDALANLMQLYIHDFSEHWSGTPNGDLQSDGRFAEYPLDNYWHEAGHIPLLLRLDGHLIGFALINTSSHSGRPIDYNMAEFFIVRKHRRSGVGTAVVRTILTRYPGWWEMAVARRNTSALEFWRRAIKQHPLVEDVQESDFTTASWNGPVLLCRVRPAKSS